MGRDQNGNHLLESIVQTKITLTLSSTKIGSQLKKKLPLLL